MRLKILLTCLGLNVFYFSFAGINITNSLKHTFVVEPGKNYSSKIIIQNIGSTFQSVELQKTDYIPLSNGASIFSDTINTLRSNRNWIVITPTETTINPNQSVSIGFEIKTPNDSTLKGTYWSVIMVEPKIPLDTAILQKGIRITSIAKYAIQVICNFGRAGLGQLEFQNIELTKEGNKSFLDFILLNSGEHLISTVVSMELFDIVTGESIKIIKASPKGVYPTLSKKWRLPLEGIPAGKTYKAVILADGSGNDVFGLEYTIKL